MGAKSDGALQPVGRRRAKVKAKPEVEPAKRISGVGVAARTVILASNNVTLTSLEVGNGGAAIRVTEQQAASLDKLGDPSH